MNYKTFKIRIYDEKDNFLYTLKVYTDLEKPQIESAIKFGINYTDTQQARRYSWPKECPWHDCGRVDHYGNCDGCDWQQTHPEKEIFTPSQLTIEKEEREF